MLTDDDGIQMDDVVQIDDEVEDDFNECDVVTADSLDEHINTASDQLQDDCGITATVEVPVAQVIACACACP